MIGLGIHIMEVERLHNAILKSFNLINPNSDNILKSFNLTNPNADNI